jgi:hypothetical protein
VDALSEAAASESFSIMSSTSWCLFCASFFISAMSGNTLVPSIYERYVSVSFLLHKIDNKPEKTQNSVVVQLGSLSVVC